MNARTAPEWIGRLYGTAPPTARTIRDLQDTRYSWWTTAEAAAAEEEWHQQNFDAEMRCRIIKPTPWVGRVIYILGLCAFVALTLGIFKRH